MAAPRATQFIALRNLTRGAQQLRQFHTPSSASFASPTAARELNSQPRTSGTPYDHSRRTTARPNASGSVSVRRFTASSQLSAARDSSTIDFFYFPSVDRDSDDGSFIMRVPILPDNYDPPRTGAHALDTEEPIVMKPEINTMSLGSVCAPMAEVTDGHGLSVDFHAMADRVAANIRSMKVPVEEQAGMMKQLWSDMVDDMLAAAAATAKKGAHS